MKRTGESISRHGKHQMVECPQCGKKMRSNNMKRHMLTHKTPKIPEPPRDRSGDERLDSEEQQGGDGRHLTVKCPQCSKTMRSDKLNTHMLTHSPSKPCRFCKNDFRSDKLRKHEALCQAKVDESLCDRSGVERLDSEERCASVSGFFNSYQLEVEKSGDYDEVISNTCTAAKDLLNKLLKKHPIKAQIVIGLVFYRQTSGGKVLSEKVFRSICEPLLLGDNIEDFFSRVKIYIKARIEEYERHGSGWVFEELKCSHLEVAKYTPLRGSGSVKIPRVVKNMHSVLNISSPDNKCFLYCLLTKLQENKPRPKKISLKPTDEKKKKKTEKKKKPERYTTYLDHVGDINMGTVTFPVKLSDIPQIEKLNGLSISVFEWNREEKCAIPLRHGCGIGTQIDLLYIQDDNTAHYLLIKDFNAFMRYRTKYHNSMFHCRKCLHAFTKQSNLLRHTDLCKQGVNQIVEMPKPGVIEFKGHHKQEKKLFAVYFDFESLTVPYNRCDNSPKIEVSSTENFQKHVPCSFSIVTTSEFEDYKEETIVYSNEDPENVTTTFISEMTRIHADMMKCYENNQHPIDISKEDAVNFKSATNCHICQKELQWDSKFNYPVRDHDHTKKRDNYRGPACNICNRNYFERTKKVPAFCHNLKGYDMNLFLLDLVKVVDKIDVIPETIEKFKALYTDDFIFLDSFAFLSSSLDKLVKSSGPDTFKRLMKEFPKHHQQLSSKGVYFYDYASSYSVFSETTLPPKEAFYSKLNEEHISDKDYERAQEVFLKTECKTLLDYMKLYVKTDAVLLCDVFESFRKLCMEYYGLDPCHFMSLPAFSWEAMLKMTGVQLEYITDLDQYTFIEQNLRGGVTTINHRHFKANNKYLDDFDPATPSSYIHYVDANNLYGAGMSSKLPTGNFRWLKEEEITQFDVIKKDPDGDTCFILEVDLAVPSTVHDAHNDYPLAVENKMIEEHQLSPHNRDFLEKNQEKFLPSRKLVPDLTNKRNYVCSLKNLQFYLKQGLVLKKIHRVLTASQSAFLKPYIDFNSDKRQKCSSQFESDFFKLCNNSIYGKTIEDLRKRSKVDIVKEEKTAKRLISRPQFKGFHILDEEITIVQSMKTKILLNKPIACGFMVLENAKNIMCDFWYSVLKPRYGNNIKLLLSDTDSFVYAVLTDDGYQDLYELRDYMDLSGYSTTSLLTPFRDVTNRKVPGKFSDEKPNEIIKEVIALKPKMYSILTKVLECNNRDPDHVCGDCCFSGHSVTAKGIKRSAQKTITHENYKTVLETSGVSMTTATVIRADKYKLYTRIITKRGLSAYDDKKYILGDGVRTLSYGHWRIE